MDSIATTPQAAPASSTQTDPTTTATAQATENDASAKQWQARISKCKTERRDRITAWAENVDYRRGKPFRQESDYDRINVNLDWSLTKGKHAQLYSQTPQVYLTPKKREFTTAVPIFAKELNDTLAKANVGAAMDEAVLDCINASGIGAAMVSYESKTAKKALPVNLAMLQPTQIEAMQATGGLKVDAAGNATFETEEVVDSRISIDRFSPADLLWDTTFTGSNFDNGPWIGRSGKMLWAEAKQAFNLTDDQRAQLIGSGKLEENLRDSPDATIEQTISYDEIYYWAYRFDPNEVYFKKIRRIVFLDGLTEPVLHEDWNGQQFDEQAKGYIGACRFPIRVLTLTYLSDDAIPPSDSAIGRPQILELVKSRSQVIMQRDRSIPMRWVNIDRVGLEVIDSINKGTPQNIIPVQGDGGRILGEVARANYAPENFEFDHIIKQDLQEQWQVGSNQIGTSAPGEQSASEVRIIQANFQSRIGYERARVAAFFVGIAEVAAGLLALYGSFDLATPEDQVRGAQWNKRTINAEFVYYIRPDSTILLDAEQRVDRLVRLLNLVGKSGYVNVKPIVEEIVALHGLDPADVMTDPKEPAPEPPKITISLKGEDLTNEIVVAMLMKAGQAPQPEDLARAKVIIAAATHGNVTMTGQPSGAPPPAGPQEPNQDWSPMERVSKRVEEYGG